MNSQGNLSDEIKGIVKDALNNKNVTNLNRNIKNVVKGALDEVRSSVDRKGTIKNNNIKSYNNVQLRKDNNREIALRNSRHEMMLKNRLAVPIGQTSGVLFTIFGAIGSAAFGIAIFILMILGFTIGSRGLFHIIAIGLSPFFILSVLSSIKGGNNRKRLKRFQRYMMRMRGRKYVLISDLSSATGLSNKAVEKDIRKMIHIGMFPEGHIDNKKTCFMLNNESYEEYLDLKRSVEITSQDTKPENRDINDDLEPEVRRVIDEGRELVLEIKEANIEIPGEEISIKLDRLEEVTGKIFDYVELCPEKFVEIKRFTEYFLPTTLKLLDAYKRLDYQSVQGDNISSAKAEIEETMDTINLAFENLLDDLFQDVAMDISTDISVLQTMFAQEGLTKNNIRVEN